MTANFWTELFFGVFSIINLMLLMKPRAVLRFFGTERYFSREAVQHPSFYRMWRVFGAAGTALTLWRIIAYFGEQ